MHKIKTYIIEHPGGGLSTFRGTKAQALNVVDGLNALDKSGAAQILSSFDENEEAEAELYRLTD